MACANSFALNIVNLGYSRIDFHPGTSESEVLADDETGCKRCGFRVFEAERLIAADRVRADTYLLVA